MNTYQYKNYAEYKEHQIRANLRKLDKCSVVPYRLTDLADRFIAPLNPEFGLCHGTRRGVEQQVFINALGCRVLGTELSPTAGQFPNTIEWDFHEIKQEWAGAVDFIYSNAWDHLFDPVKGLNNWVRCLKDHGLILLEYTPAHRSPEASSTDCFRGSLEDFTEFLTGSGFNVREVYRPDDIYQCIILGKH